MRLIEDEALRTRIQRHAEIRAKTLFANEVRRLFPGATPRCAEHASRSATRASGFARCACSSGAGILRPARPSGAAVSRHDAAAGTAAGMKRDAVVCQRPLSCGLASLAASAVRRELPLAHLAIGAILFPVRMECAGGFISSLVIQGREGDKDVHFIDDYAGTRRCGRACCWWAT